MTVETKGSRASSSAADGHPSGDHRFKVLDGTMKRLKFEPSALIEVLHTAQELFGHLDHDLLYYIARGLKLPPSRVYGAATFYHFFTFAPQGKHTCVVCTGTACFVKGGEELARIVAEITGAQPGTTTADGQFSFSTARCLGSCGLAPLAVFDGEVQGNQTPDMIRQHLSGWGVKHGSE